MNRRKDTFGFTIIEILLVIFIIGLLSAVGVNVYLEQQKSSRDATRKSDMYLIASGLDNYYSVNKKYPLYDGTINYGSILPDQTSFIKTPLPGHSCHYFSDGKMNSTGSTNNPNQCNVPASTGMIKNWIPGLSGTYISNLPTDPKQKEINFTEYDKILANYAGNSFIWSGGSSNTFLYFYSKFNKQTSNGIYLSEIPQKYYFIGAALENLEDKDMILQSKKMFAGKYIAQKAESPPTNTFNLNSNLYVLTSEL